MQERLKRDPSEVVLVPFTDIEEGFMAFFGKRAINSNVSPEDRLSGAIALTQTLSRPTVITGEQIERFCGGCDFYGENGICTRTDGIVNQPRYVALQQCGLAAVGEKKGYMKINGFEPEGSQNR